MFPIENTWQTSIRCYTNCIYLIKE
jgi:hypothetical protein